MLLFIASKLHFFHPSTAVPRRVGRAALPSHLLVYSLCSEFTLPWLMARFWTPDTVKRQYIRACDFENSNLLLFLKGTLTRQGAKLFFMQFCFSFKQSKKMLLTLFAPNQHAAALVVDCRGVNSALFLYGYDFCTVQLSKQDKKREHALKKDQWLFSQTCFILSDAKYLLSILLCSDVGKPPCFMCSLHLQTVWYVV